MTATPYATVSGNAFNAPSTPVLIIPDKTTTIQIGELEIAHNSFINFQNYREALKNFILTVVHDEHISKLKEPFVKFRNVVLFDMIKQINRSYGTLNIIQNFALKEKFNKAYDTNKPNIIYYKCINGCLEMTEDANNVNLTNIQVLQQALYALRDQII